MGLILDYAGGSSESEPEEESGGDAPLITNLQVDMDRLATGVPPELEPTTESDHSTPALEQASRQDTAEVTMLTVQLHVSACE